VTADEQLVAKGQLELNALGLGAVVTPAVGPPVEYQATNEWRGLLSWIVVGRYRGYSLGSATLANTHPDGLVVVKLGGES
jgi:hypothetical protein